MNLRVNVRQNLAYFLLVYAETVRTTWLPGSYLFLGRNDTGSEVDCSHVTELLRDIIEQDPRCRRGSSAKMKTEFVWCFSKIIKNQQVSPLHFHHLSAQLLKEHEHVKTTQVMSGKCYALQTVLPITQLSVKWVRG